MKPYLVDVPVRITIWIRPECQRQQFEVLKKARPSILFIQSDGGRNDEEWKAIRQNREMFENEIDWDCKVYKLYENSNQGLYKMGHKVTDFIWKHVDRCILLEDDQIPSVSFFRYCAELLEKYKDDDRIECVCGMNHLGKSEEVTSDYFFSRQGSIWGVALWKRTVEDRDNEFKYGKDPYLMKLLKQRTKYNSIFMKRIEAYSKQKYYEGHVASDEFFIEFAMYGQNRLQIIPKYNLINNVGATENATNSGALDNMPRGLRQVFNMKTYELDFPLKHMEYVIPDINYEVKRNKIMAYNYPRIAFARRLEKIIILIKNGKLLDVIKNKFARRRYIEN